MPGQRAVLWALTKAAGLGRYRSAGLRAREVARSAQTIALSQSSGLVFVYLNDCDQAGHAHGWMSPQYLAAAVEVDAAIGVLAEPHIVNERIPLILAGPDVTRHHQLTRPVSLLDVPPTLLWWFGLEIPGCYEGRVLRQAFTGTPRTLEPAL
jgi:hypothetical protein